MQKRQPVYSYEGQNSLLKDKVPKRTNQNLMQSQVVRRPTREHLRLDTSDDNIADLQRKEIIVTD